MPGYARDFAGLVRRMAHRHREGLAPVAFD
jgi:hypothetical protein